ncbi:MAG: type IV toxin-antitoxin system AbiEi family antitoxin domain-containing protein [Acidimicrobiales bacterium]
MFDRRVAPNFARQHGLLTRAQAMEAGATPEMIQHRLEVCRWVRVASGVYRLAGVAVTWRQKALAACLAAGPEAVISHRAAAVVFGVSGYRPGPVDITVPPGRSGRNELATVHRSLLLPRDRATKDRLPVTAPARMVRDLARSVSPDLVEEAVDDVLCRRLVSLDKLLREPNPVVLRTILEAWTPGALPGSVAEMDVVRALLAAGLGDPVRQFVIAAADARVDLAYPDHRLAIELDSFRWHAGRRPFASDRSRGNRIVAAGWHLLRAAPGDLSPLISAAATLTRRVA